MKLRKSLLTCAITIALGSSFAASANTDDKTQSSTELASQVSTLGVSNSITLDQVSVTGVGNDAVIAQQGTGHRAETVSVGDGNMVEVSQAQTSNLSLIYNTGDDNTVSHSQNGTRQVHRFEKLRSVPPRKRTALSRDIDPRDGRRPKSLRRTPACTVQSEAARSHITKSPVHSCVVR